MRLKIVGVALALGTLVAVPAFADEGKGDHPSFPIPAATFKQRIDAKTQKAREHMEKRASELPADQAKELRAKFDASIAKMNAEVAKATADGTVTKDEAKAVWQAGPHRGRHHKGEKGAEKK